MRRGILLSTAATVVCGLLAAPALADVFVLATINKDKDIDVDETINVTKRISIFADVIRSVDKVAEADTVVNQANHDNEACGSCAEKFDHIFMSANGNTGITAVNQAAGNMNNQANVVTAAIDFPPRPGDGDGGPGDGDGDGEFPPGTGSFANAQSSVDQRQGVIRTPIYGDGDGDGDIVGYNTLQAGNIIKSVDILFREARIVDSFNHNLGVTHGNQAVGQMNNQANVLTLAAGLAGGVALAEADLGQEIANNTVNEAFAEKRAILAGSVNDNHGVVGLNQTAGNIGNQANVVAVGAAVHANALR